MADQASPDPIRSWILGAERSAIRLDAFIRECLPHLSRREIDAAVRGGLFSINGKVSKKGERLAGGDSLQFTGPTAWLAPSPLANFELDVPIVYEDATVLLVDKPGGMATHGFSARDSTTLANFLLARWPELASVGRKRWEPGIVHRLDRETSGLVLIAKNQAAFENLRLQFQRRQVEKIYRALVWGKTPPAGTIDFPLAHARGDKRRMIALTERRKESKLRTWKAITHYRRLSQGHGLSLLEIAMDTGVTHQIRVHLAAIGHPIVADPLYGVESADRFALARHFLHAYRLKFCHPEDGRSVEFVAELPIALAEILLRLGIVT
ncbi:MAG: RluA family pseudouridine synthase [Chloroflexota bacterium]